MADWKGKVVLVTGGSSGLGFAIAQAFGQAGARVVISARNEVTLGASAAQLDAEKCSVASIPADVTDQASVERLMASTVDQFGRLDVLVNNAGRSMRRAVIETTAEDFRDLMDLNLLGVVRCTRAAAPHLLASRGHLVNIGSLAAKAAGRYTGAYPATKFALAAYNQQLRLELGPRGLHVLLVCPGPIARDQPRAPEERKSRGDDGPGLPASAYQPGAGVKTRPMRPEKLARAIVRACERRKGEIIYPRTARFLFALMQLSPRLADWLIRWTT